MINLRMTNKREDIRAWTGLPADDHDKALWDAGFNLDDWDVCFESDVRLIDEDGESWSRWVPEAHWLGWQMENYCVGYHEVEYGGKWYYTVHHA